MSTPPADLNYIERCYRTAAHAVMEIYGESEKTPGAPPGLGDSPPPLLMEAMERLLQILGHLQPDSPPIHPAAKSGALETQDINALGDYGIRLLRDLAQWARVLGLTQAYRDLHSGLFALALWTVHHGGEISVLEPVVDTLAFLANSIRTPVDLEQLYLAASTIMESVSPAIAQDSDRSNPGRPWRVLLQNRAIIATRSHQPALMEQAFNTLVEMLPEDAPGFFREGMEQMDALNYPPHVRRVMEKYYQLWCSPRTLH